MDNRKLIAKKFIIEHPLGVLSISRGDSAPYAASVFIVSDDQLNLFFITKVDTEKYHALNKNNQVAVTVTDFKEQQTIQAEGSAEQITAEGGIMEEIFRQLSNIKPLDNSNWLPPIIKIKAGDYAIFQIKLSNLRFSDFSNKLDSQLENVSRQII